MGCSDFSNKNKRPPPALFLNGPLVWEHRVAAYSDMYCKLGLSHGVCLNSERQVSSHGKTIDFESY